ncbi:SDR family NAD(P)-dependent oxidoreductase [Streptomyces sp. NPDC019224]|uniref:SDR family NAD(P)-dependent oxidoreductase n=1 Tax=Streptomyces sp. NPDC019224 TaxID=3154484 RepID=UPI0033F322D0
MSRILITGSTDGLGYAAAAALLFAGHNVVVHARNPERAGALDPLIGRGAELVVADFADRDAVRHTATELNGKPPLDTVIHNAGVWSGPAVMPVNVVAPYLLTALLHRPYRLLYLSSSSHFDGRPSPAGIDWRGTTPGSYADSKLFVTTLAAAAARLFPDVLSNAVDPGWVPTRMGGPGAPDDLELGHLTQQWLAASDEPQALTTGGYWYHQQRQRPHPAVHDEAFQHRLLQTLAEETGTSWAAAPAEGRSLPIARPGLNRSQFGRDSMP